MKEKNLISLGGFSLHLSSKRKSMRLQHNNEVNRRDTLYDMLRREESQIEFLEKLNRDLQRDFESLTFPKYIKFGFASFLIFAVSGVVFPLTYNV